MMRFRFRGAAAVPKAFPVMIRNVIIAFPVMIPGAPIVAQGGGGDRGYDITGIICIIAAVPAEVEVTVIIEPRLRAGGLGMDIKTYKY